MQSLAAVWFFRVCNREIPKGTHHCAMFPCLAHACDDRRTKSLLDQLAPHVHEACEVRPSLESNCKQSESLAVDS